MTDVRLIEMHDAQVGAVVVGGDHRLVVIFRRLPVYREEPDAPERQRLWWYRAALEASGVRAFSTDIVIDPDNWVADGTAGDGNDADSNFASFVGASRACSSFELSFASGAKLKLACETIRVRLGIGTPTDEVWIDREPQKRNA